MYIYNILKHTIIWKKVLFEIILLLKYSRENFRGFSVPSKIFNKLVSCSITIIVANPYQSFIPCKIYYQAIAVERISNR